MNKVTWRKLISCPRCMLDAQFSEVKYVNANGNRLFCPHCGYVEAKG